MPDTQLDASVTQSVGSEPSIAVIGAGVTGVTTAYNLARRGCTVTLFDKHP